MTKIWYLPLEPIEKRYTKDWYSQFPTVFREKYKLEMIDGKSIKSDLKGKFFLDPINTNIWKLTQLQGIIERIRDIEDEDIVFVFDGWFPGIEALAYARDLLGKKFKIMSYWHAGTYDKWDLTAQMGLGRYGKSLEEAWFEIYDMIFVATEFHKKMILKERKINPDKIKVVGFPLDIEKIAEYKTTAQKGIFFSGRLTREKGYNEVMDLVKEGEEITVALDKDFSKEDYYKEMAKHNIIFAPSEQETFGIGVVEGMALGLKPVVPDKLAFKETVPKPFRYKNRKQMLHMLRAKIERIDFRHVYEYQYQNVIREIMKWFE